MGQHGHPRVIRDDASADSSRSGAPHHVLGEGHSVRNHSSGKGQGQDKERRRKGEGKAKERRRKGDWTHMLFASQGVIGSAKASLVSCHIKCGTGKHESVTMDRHMREAPYPILDA